MTPDQEPELRGETPPERRPNFFRLEFLVLLVAVLVGLGTLAIYFGGGDEPIPPSIPEQERMNPASPSQGEAQ